MASSSAASAPSSNEAAPPSSNEAAPPSSNEAAPPSTNEAAPPSANEAAPPSTVGDAQTDGAIPTTKDPIEEPPEFNVKVVLANLQADPNNPLYSVKTFEDLKLCLLSTPDAVDLLLTHRSSPNLLQGIRSLNFSKPSKVQEKALPLLLANPPTNMIAQSQSGTGKTAAFTLNMLSRIDVSNRRPQALVLAPSRELARQIQGVIAEMGRFMDGLLVTSAVPDPRHRNKKFEGQIIVGTPGTVLDMIRRQYLDATQIKILVLDEADNMLDQQGLGDQCKRVKSMLKHKPLQTVLFSATFPSHVIDYAKVFAPDANTLTLAHEELTIEGIKQLYVDCEHDKDKFAKLLKFYGMLTNGSSIVFVRALEQRMIAEGHKVAQLSGALDGPERDRIIDQFRNGEAKVLIATNVLARGIDVQSVTMVINYDLPTKADNRTPDPETYLHRIGRTGRFGRVGVALSFVHNKDSWRILKDITDYFNTSMVSVDVSDWDRVEAMIKRIIMASKTGKSSKEIADMVANG